MNVDIKPLGKLVDFFPILRKCDGDNEVDSSRP